MFWLGPLVFGWGSATGLHRRIARDTRRRLEGHATGWFPPAALATAIGLFAGGMATATVLEVFPARPDPAAVAHTPPVRHERLCREFTLISGGEKRVILVDESGIPCP